MKKVILLILFQAFCTAGFSQSLPPDMTGGIYFQRTNLVVRWKASQHPWPKTLSVLSMVPTKYSPAVISNLMALGSFTEKDKTDYGTNGIPAIFFSKSGRILALTFTLGEIHYNLRDYSWSANLAKDVPTTNQLFQLTTNFLQKLGVNLSEIAKGKNGKPEITCLEHEIYIYPKDTNIELTNIDRGEAHFHRTIDGASFIYPGGSGEIDFGEYGQITKIDIYWPSYERVNQYSAAMPKKIIQWIHEGRAGQKHIIQANGPEIFIDWATAKSLTIEKAVAYYDVDFFDFERLERPIFPSYAHPYAELWGTVDTGTTNIPVVLDCPIIDERKP